MPAPTPLRALVERTVAEAVDGVVAQAVGKTMPRVGESGRFRVSHVGAFSRRGVADLIRMAANPELEGAIVFVDGDVLRALYARGGRLVGADSNVLFERLGRILEKAGKVDRDTRRALVSCEESGGTSAAAVLVPADTARFGLELRVREVAETLFLVKRGEFVVIEGTPSLAPVPEVSLDPEEVAREGIARYEAWRSGASVAAAPSSPAAPAPPKVAPVAPASAAAIDLPPAVGTTPPPRRPETLPPRVMPESPTVDLEPPEIDLEPEPAAAPSRSGPSGPTHSPPSAAPSRSGPSAPAPAPPAAAAPRETARPAREIPILDVPPPTGPMPPLSPTAASPGETQDVTLEALDLDLPPPEPRGSTTTTSDLEPVRDPPQR
jgi:hypothetical protein